MKIKKITAVLLFIFAAFIVYRPFGADAEPGRTLIAEGKDAGPNISWAYYNDGTLELSGAGSMYRWWNPLQDSAPWNSFKNSIQTVKISEGITAIGDWAFANCENMTSAEIPESVTDICLNAFQNCDSLISVNIPGISAFIDPRAFSLCDNLVNIVLNPGNINYTIIDGVLFSKDAKKIAIYPYAKSGEYYEIPDGVTSVGDHAFYFASKLKEIKIPESVTVIGSSAFFDCMGLIKINIPQNVSVIEEYTFYNCNKMKSVKIPDGVTSLGMYAFWNWKNLTSVTIPAAVGSIGMRAFFNCENLNCAVFLGDVPDSFGENVFGGVSPGFTVYYFEGAKGFSEPVWKGYKTQMMPAKILYGDINGDGFSDTADLVGLSRHIAEIEPISNPVFLKAADLTGDGRVTIADIIKLARYLAGIDKTEPGEVKFK